MSLTKEEKASLIDSTNWANDFTWAQMLLLSDYLKVHYAQPQDLICDEGDKGDSMSILIQGVINVSKDNKTMVELKSGRTFGEMSLFDNEPRSAKIVAVERCTFLTITRTDFEKLSKEYPALALKVAMKIARLLSQNIRRLSGQLCDYLEHH